MEIIQNIIPENRGNRPSFFMLPKYITIHDTANPNATAIAHGHYLARNSIAERLPVSWHFTVDDTNIVQHLPLNESAWHAGDGLNGTGNRKSIGVEICEFTDINKRYKAEKNAVYLVVYLVNELSISINNIVQHNYWTGKDCPRVLRGKPNGWNNFIEAVRKNMEEKQDVPEWKKKGLEWLEKNGLITPGRWQAEDVLDMGTFGEILSRITITGRSVK